MAEDIIRENSEDGVELSDESLDSIAGGYVLNNGTDYEVIDEKGDVVETIPGTTMASYESARQRARELGLHDFEITWGELNNLRKRGGIGNY